MNGRIAIFLHQPKCSVQSGNGIMQALYPHYSFKIFTKHEIEDDFFDDVDMVCFPGGFGDSDAFDYLLPNHIKSIKKFLHRGGKYLGICMGAYWADKDYFNIVDDVRVVQYIKQPNTDTRRPHAKAINVIWKSVPEKMYFYDGCTFVGDTSNYEIVSTYANGNPMAIMKQNIGLIGCHPESTKHWFESYSWMKKHYHNGTHHRLLLDFVNTLMRK
jgi:glutamine amidotransferase-like uncharacterized protein